MIRVKVTQNDFDRIADELAPKVRAAVDATALDISAAAKRSAPVLTGNLRRSLHTRHLRGFRSRVGTNVEYAPFVEYGTSRMAARPYLTPAVEAVRGAFIDRLRRVFGRG